jgi:hypothetical protein
MGVGLGRPIRGRFDHAALIVDSDDTIARSGCAAGTTTRRWWCRWTTKAAATQ